LILGLLLFRRESFVPLVHITGHPGTASSSDMHTESRDAVPFRFIVSNESVFSACDFPHGWNCEETAGDIVRTNPLPIFCFFSMIIQSATESNSLPDIDRRTFAEEHVDARLLRSFGGSERVFRACIQDRDQLVFVGFVHIEMEFMAIAHDKMLY